MHSVKIHPFILLSLFFSSISIGMYVFQNFANQQLMIGFILLLIELLVVGLLVFGLIYNRKLIKMEKCADGKTKETKVAK